MGEIQNRYLNLCLTLSIRHFDYFHNDAIFNTWPGSLDTFVQMIGNFIFFFCKHSLTKKQQDLKYCYCLSLHQYATDVLGKIPGNRAAAANGSYWHLYAQHGLWQQWSIHMGKALLQSSWPTNCIQLKYFNYFLYHKTRQPRAQQQQKMVCTNGILMIEFFLGIQFWSLLFKKKLIKSFQLSNCNSMHE